MIYQFQFVRTRRYLPVSNISRYFLFYSSRFLQPLQYLSHLLWFCIKMEVLLNILSILHHEIDFLILQPSPKLYYHIDSFHLYYYKHLILRILTDQNFLRRIWQVFFSNNIFYYTTYIHLMLILEDHMMDLTFIILLSHIRETGFDIVRPFYMNEI